MLGAASLGFRSVCEEDLYKSFQRLVDLYSAKTIRLHALNSYAA